jgi:hypothetical protein
MWMCSACGLAQLVDDPGTKEEPSGIEPLALVRQANDAMTRLMRGGFLRRGQTFVEFDSPHGGSVHQMLLDRGLRPAVAGELADVVIDMFGMMHEPQQDMAVAERAARLKPDGFLFLQYHSLSSIIHSGQWNALRHGHYAYYSTATLANMLAAQGIALRSSWKFDLYGGTVMVAASRGVRPDSTVVELLAEEGIIGANDLDVVGVMQKRAETTADALREWLLAARASGHKVYGYGAASRAVALLNFAGIGPELLPAIADAAPQKSQRRMPATHVPIISPAELVARQPDFVLLFVPDLLAELASALPQFADRWVLAEPMPRLAGPRDLPLVSSEKPAMPQIWEQS